MPRTRMSKSKESEEALATRLIAQGYRPPSEREAFESEHNMYEDGWVKGPLTVSLTKGGEGWWKCEWIQIDTTSPEYRKAMKDVGNTIYQVIWLFYDEHKDDPEFAHLPRLDERFRPEMTYE